MKFSFFLFLSPLSVDAGRLELECAHKQPEQCEDLKSEKNILENCGAQQHGARSTLRVDSSRYTFIHGSKERDKEKFIHEKVSTHETRLWTQWNKSQPPSRRGKFFAVCCCKRYWIIVCIGVQEIVDHQREILPLLHTRPLVGDVSSLRFSFNELFDCYFFVILLLLCDLNNSPF